MKRRLALVLAAALLGSSCQGLGRAASNPFGDRRSAEIQLVVINDDFYDATLYAHRGTDRQRLGIVTGKSQGSFTIGWPNPQPLRVEINLSAGAGSCTTSAITVDPGEALELTILSDYIRRGQCGIGG